MGFRGCPCSWITLGTGNLPQQQARLERPARRIFPPRCVAVQEPAGELGLLGAERLLFYVFLYMCSVVAKGGFPKSRLLKTKRVALASQPPE